MQQETKTPQAQRLVQAPSTTGDKRKKTLEDYKKESQENKHKWMPLVRYMKKHNIKFKTARCGKVRIEYFRTEELEDLIQNNKAQLQNNSVLKDLITAWEKDVVYFVRPQNMPKLKYPKQLQKSEGNSTSKFASFKFDTAEPRTWLFPTILLGIIAVVLFPLWPYALKYAVFMICLVLVTAILSLIALRLVVYLLFAIFGVSFWILPNFFADCTIAESFIPVYSAKKWQSGVFSIVGRLLAFSIFAYYAYHLYIDSSWVYENIEITKTSFDDLHDWGVGKIKGEKNFSQSALTNLDHIINQTADAHVEERLDLEAPEETNDEKESEEHNGQGQEENKENQENDAQTTQDQEVNDTADSAQL